MCGVGLAGAGLAEAHHAALAAAGLLAHQEEPQRAEEHEGDDQREPLGQPGGLRRQLGCEAEGVFGGADALAQHLLIDQVDVLVEAVHAGDDDREIVAARELALRNLAVLLQAVQRVFLNDDAVDGHIGLLALQLFAVVRAQIRLHPLQEFGVAQGDGFDGAAGAEHPYDGENDCQKQQIHQRPLEHLLFLVQTFVLSFHIGENQYYSIL